jgi:hypothetical protein
MRHGFRLALATSAGLLALGLGDEALGAYNPKVHMSLSTEQGVTVGYTQGADDDASARLTFYSPVGMQLDLGAPLGATIGSASTRASIGSAGGAVAQLSGPVLVGNGADPAVAAASVACTGQSTHNAVWILAVALQDQPPLNVPAFVDLTTGPEGTFSSSKVVVCFRSPYVPPDQGGQPLGVKPLEANLTLTDVYDYPGTVAALRWTGLFIPYAVGTKSPNPRQAAESQAIDKSPVAYAFSGKQVVKTKRIRRGKRVRRIKTYFARLTGRVQTGGDPRVGAPVTLLRNGKRVALVRTNARGRFTKTVPLPGSSVFVARLRSPSRDTSGDCVPVIPLAPQLDARCTGLTLSGLSSDAGTTVRKR